MKLIKRILMLVVIVFMVANLSLVGSIRAFAHPAILDVNYDYCDDLANGDGIDEVWYILDKDALSRHISDEVTTIRYYFAERDPNTGCTWVPANETENTAQQIKTAYENSMKKWNNVYFYSYNPDGSITKNKVINVVEGTADNHNLIIYPDITITSIASTGTLGDAVTLSTETITHKHYANWYMRVNINYFYFGGSYSNAYVSTVQQRTGAHELGHVLGLRDVDYENICNSDGNSDHHQEVLMGYGSPMTSRSSDIKYKDIAGVAITRGFHTDNNHKWLNMGQQSDGTYKLVCSICNGVRSATTNELSGYSYYTYGSCSNEHNLSSGNMMAVASYGNKDYYKCKYCRYVAPFSEIVTQDYSIQSVSNYRHKFESNNGLEYFFYEDHTIVNNVCTKCGASHTHEYNTCVYMNKLSHKMVCACGAIGSISAHYVVGGPAPGQTSAPCGGCGCDLDLLHNGQVGIMSATQVSVNGSYILPNGIVVLVEEDVEAYLAGTLQFYHPEDVPVTQ